MFWFWNKDSRQQKMQSPKRIPSPVAHYLVDQQKDPYWVWNLWAVMRPKGEDKHTFEYRVFDKEQALSLRIVVKNYDTLTEHPELILYEGWCNEKTRQAKVEARQALDESKKINPRKER